jgi:hypothetical protein
MLDEMGYRTMIDGRLIDAINAHSTQTTPQWTSYTPTITAINGTFTTLSQVVGFFIQPNPKSVLAYGSFIISDVGTASLAYNVSLPIKPSKAGLMGIFPFNFQNTTASLVLPGYCTGTVLQVTANLVTGHQHIFSGFYGID